MYQVQSVLNTDRKMQENSQMSPSIQEEVTRAVTALRKGRVLLYPTDTIWGLGCDIFNESAVKRIYEIKQRPENKPFVLLVDSIEMLKKYIKDIHPRVETLLTHHIQPLTIIYQSNGTLPDYLVSEEGTLAIRVTQDEFCKQIIGALGQPIISTSANRAEQPYPKNFQEIDEVILKMADDIVDFRIKGEEGDQIPSVIATFNHKGDLSFIRN